MGKMITLPIASDLNLTSYDAASDLLPPSTVRDIIIRELIVPRALEEIAKMISGERFCTVRVLPDAMLSSSHLWALCAGHDVVWSGALP